MSAPKATGLTPGVLDKTAPPAPEFDPALVEQAARALPWDRTAGGWLQNLDAARAVLTAVAPTLLAKGAACSCGGSGLYPNEVPGVGTEWVSCPDCNRAEIEAIAYQRGKVEGARQVLAAVEAATARRNALGWANDAAREAVARIEGGASHV